MFYNHINFEVYSLDQILVKQTKQWYVAKIIFPQSVIASKTILEHKNYVFVKKYLEILENAKFLFSHFTLRFNRKIIFGSLVQYFSLCVSWSWLGRSETFSFYFFDTYFYFVFWWKSTKIWSDASKFVKKYFKPRQIE